MSAYSSTSSVQYAANVAITRKPFSLGNYRKLVWSFLLVSYKLILSCAGPCGVWCNEEGCTNEILLVNLMSSSSFFRQFAAPTGEHPTLITVSKETNHLPQKGGEMYLLWSYQISAAWYVGCSNANLQLGKWCNAPHWGVYDVFHSTLKAMSVVLHFGVVLFLYVKDRGTDSGLFKFQAWIQGATSECAHNMLQPSNFSELFKLIVTGVVSLSIGIRISCHRTIVGLLCITASQLQYRSWHIFQHLEIIDLASAYVYEFVFCFIVWGLGFL